MADGGVWVRVYPDAGGGGGAGAAVIDDAASNYDSKDAGVVIDGKTYDIYTFTTATTTFSIRLTDEARARITDEDVLMAVATTNMPSKFTGDPVELFDSRYRDVLRNAFDITPYADPGLSLSVASAGIADVLLVGGGGGGGAWAAGGGGGGSFIENIVFLDAKTHNVNVGDGGAGGRTEGGTANRPGINGGASTIGAVAFATGGGGGGSYEDQYPKDGGNGGGAGYLMGSIDVDGGVGFFGFDGGGSYTSVAGGGGGGAGEAGEGSATGSGVGGKGGDGKPSSILGGSPVMYGGGGGGSGQEENSHGEGGNGGGGAGSSNIAITATDGDPNTGGGGGGTRNRSDRNDAFGGNGGSGIVIVRVEI